MYGFMDGNDGIGFMKWPVWYFSGRGFFLCHWEQLVEEGCGCMQVGEVAGKYMREKMGRGIFH